jgi:hypothetical protein
MDLKESAQDNINQINLKGDVDRSNADWFGDLTILPLENDKTLLTGHFADQTAVQGFLDHLWNLNFTMLSVEKLEDLNLFHTKESKSGHQKIPGSVLPAIG